MYTWPWWRDFPTSWSFLSSMLSRFVVSVRRGGGMCWVHRSGLPGEEGICVALDKTKHLWPFFLMFSFPSPVSQRLCTLLVCSLKRDLLAGLTVLTWGKTLHSQWDKSGLSTYLFVVLEDILKIRLDRQKRCVPQKWTLYFLVCMHKCEPFSFPFLPTPHPRLSLCSLFLSPSLPLPVTVFCSEPRLPFTWWCVCLSPCGTGL